MRREPHVRFCERAAVRFRRATHLVILTASEKEARWAFGEVERLLRGRGLALNRDKTRIVPPGEEVQFLGCTVTARAFRATPQQQQQPRGRERVA